MVSETIEERINNLDKMLDEFSNKHCIKFENNTEINNIINYTQNDIKNLSEEECISNAFLLYRHAGYIQKEANRLEAKIKWINRCIQIETADKIRTYGDKYTSFQERTIMLNSDKTNIYMCKLQELLIECEVRKEELSFISSRISAMGNLLENNKKLKARQKWQE